MSGYAKGTKGACDRLWAQIIRARANGCCERCGTPGPVQAAHIFRKGYNATRHDLRNGRGLCGNCHTGQDGVDLGMWDWPELIGVVEYEDLRLFMRNNTPFSPPAGMTLDGWWQHTRDTLKTEAVFMGLAA